MKIANGKLVPSPSERGWGEAVLLYTALSIAALTFIYPFIWMIGASFAPMHEVGTMTLLASTSYLG